MRKTTKNVMIYTEYISSTCTLIQTMLERERERERERREREREETLGGGGREAGFSQHDSSLYIVTIALYSYFYSSHACAPGSSRMR